MIVDLERNDLGRVCVAGLASRVDGARAAREPSDGASPGVARRRRRCATTSASRALLRATFPGGSITGAPKVRAMEIIAELEPAPRGVYTGALGLFASARRPRARRSPIRTAVVRDGVVALARRRRHRRRLGPRSASSPRLAQDGGAPARARRGRDARARAVLVWLNGRVRRRRATRASRRSTAACSTATALYDTWRTYDGEPFAVAAHLRRLAAAAARARPAAARVRPRVWERRARARSSRRNGLADAAVRLTITRGAAGDAPRPGARARRRRCSSPCARCPPTSREQQARGIAAVLLPFPRDAAPPWGGLKLLGHASAVVGRALARRARRARGPLRHGRAARSPKARRRTSSWSSAARSSRRRSRRGVLPGVTRDLVLRARAPRRPRACARSRCPVAPAPARADEVVPHRSTVEVLPRRRASTAGASGGGRPGAGHPRAPGALSRRGRRRARARAARCRRRGQPDSAAARRRGRGGDG